MKKLVTMIAVFSILGGAFYLFQDSSNIPKESTQQSAQGSNAEALIELIVSDDDGSKDSSETIDLFFRDFNIRNFAAIHDDLIHKDALVLKNYKYFVSTLSEIRDVTGLYYYGSQRGMGMGAFTWGTDQMDNVLETSLSLKTTTIKWGGEFENGMFYLDFKFVRNSNKLIEVNVADDPLSAEFKKSF